MIERINEFKTKLKEKSHLNCIINDLSDIALNQNNNKSNKGPLSNKLIAIKDNLNYIGSETTCASNILKGHKSIYNATVVQKIIDAGGSIVAKTNMDEFAMGSSSEYSSFGPTLNPINTQYTPGGSSGGSAVSVASKLVDIALGSDTGGSVRQPAAFCGIYGLKPTYGRLSRYGLVAFASSFDQVGIFSNNTEDMVLLYEEIAGFDENDSTSVNIPVKDFKYNENINNITIGIPKEYLIDGIDNEIRLEHNKLVSYLKQQGFNIKEISMPYTDKAVATYYILTTAEASSNLSRYDGIRYGMSIRKNDIHEMYTKTRDLGFGNEVKRRIILGTFVLSSGYYDNYFAKAQKVRNLIRQDFVRAFQDVDILLTPTTPYLPFKIGEKINNPLQMYLADIFTVPINLAGVPALNIPCGFSSKGFPIGLQLISNYFNENTLFNLSMYLENNYN